MRTAYSQTTTETIPLGPAPESGAMIYQVTSYPAINDHMYFEVPYMDASSRYVMFERHHNAIGPVELWRADLERNLVTRVAVTSGALRGHAVSTDHRLFFYTDTADEGLYDLVQIDIVTLEERRWSFSGGGLTPRSRGSVTPDLRYYINSAYLGDKRFGIWRLDLTTGERQVILEGGADHCNMHPQLDPGGGRDLLIQHNRGAELDDEGRHTRLVGEIGATLYVVDIDGGHKRQLPVGKPHTARCQGHQCWIGTTGDILLTIGDQDREALAAQGNLLMVRPGDQQARVVASGAYFDHTNASRDGRFFVSDTHPDATILVGSIATGRWRVLCESGSIMGSPQYSHPHPYLSPDNGWVIYNSIGSGIPHVYAARVPEGLLEELDTP